MINLLESLMFENFAKYIYKWHICKLEMHWIFITELYLFINKLFSITFYVSQRERFL